jgi:ABC-2 type transport system permease protein
VNLTYVRFELVRLFRNRLAFFFTLVFPLVLFLIFGGSNRNAVIDVGSVKLKYPLFYMVAMAGYGAMGAGISGGFRIATERSVGWNRQLRLTPLSVRTYFRTKVLSSYVMALISIVVLYAAGILIGVRIDTASRWLQMTGLILVGILPFVALGILFGHLLTVDSIGPALGGGTALFALLGGIWFPFADGSVLQKIGEYVPSYWIAQASHIGIGGNAWGTKGWIVVLGWTAVVSAFAARAYQRDTKKV